MRTFEDKPAVRDAVPLIIGLTGCSSSGKTYSALRLATGVQKVRGGEIWGIDAESGRMSHYAPFFKFRHLRFDPPHGPADYEAALHHCYSKGARIIVVDSMSHEHDGEGGVLDQIDEFLEKKCGDDWQKRQTMNFVAQVRPKAARKALNRRILQLSDVTFILCYRAQEKLRPKKGQEPEKLGWQPITTSMLPYEMTIRFLLGPGSDGVPSLTPETEAEKLAVKMPRQFRDWFKPGDQLSEATGEKLARWAAGDAAPATPTAAKASRDELAVLSKELAGVGIGTPELRKEWIEKTIGRPIKSPADMSPDEVSTCMLAAKEAA